MVETDRQTGGLFDVMNWCGHAPSVGCPCRKPGTGLVGASFMDLRGAGLIPAPGNGCLFVGDRPEDEQCAAGAGVRFVHAAQWRADPVDRWLP